MTRTALLLVLLVLAFGSRAEAAFGRGRGSSSHGSAPVSRGRHSSGRSFGYGGYVPHYSVGYWAPTYPIAAYPPVAYPYASTANPGPEYEQPGAPPGVAEVGLRVVAALDIHGAFSRLGSPGVGLNVNVSVEGDRFGLFLRGGDFVVPSLVDANAVDHLGNLSAHGSFALLAGPVGRFRLLFGADSVFAPNLIAVGPSVGLSASIYLGGVVELEGSFTATLWPYTQLAGQAGLAIGAGPVGFKLGWRTVLLNDHGLVDGYPAQDVFNGPYAGIGIAF